MSGPNANDLISRHLSAMRPPPVGEKELALGRRQLHNLNHLHAEGLKQGQRAPEVSDLQYYLRSLGYIQEDDAITDGLFDESTAKALNRFQAFYGLSASSTLDAPTLAIMRMPRSCGVPDVLPRYLRAFRNPWPKTSLSYYFSNIDDSPDINSREKAAAAFQSGYSLWSAVTPIRFSHDPNNPSIADITVSWGYPNCRAYADACTDWPYPGNPIDKASSIFKITALWKVADVQSGDYDMVAFAAHEVGHALGLYFPGNEEDYSHSPNPDALMYPTIPAGRRRLHPDDVAAAKRVYG